MKNKNHRTYENIFVFWSHLSLFTRLPFTAIFYIFSKTTLPPHELKCVRVAFVAERSLLCWRFVRPACPPLNVRHRNSVSS